MPEQKGELPLKPAQMSADSVVVEVFFVRCPVGDNRVNCDLWEEVDEQQFAVEVRQRLVNNGFRAGLVFGQIPVVLSQLLELADKPAPQEGALKTELSTLEAEPTVIRRHIQTRPAQRNEIVASSIYDSLPVLVSEQGEVRGQTYREAQGVLALKTFPQSDGRVRLSLIPELHHEQVRKRWVGRQGMLQMEASRPRRTFDEMGLLASLVPGDMLVMTSLPDRPGSLGHQFFATSEGEPGQKLLVVRLAQTQRDGVVR
ncbi:MAG: hypothetical protein U1E05_12085 [Patescibacteria group bacterium]|nr:hypothetical protein [Patescibacteria group bacterium]